MTPARILWELKLLHFHRGLRNFVFVNQLYFSPLAPLLLDRFRTRSEMDYSLTESQRSLETGGEITTLNETKENLSEVMQSKSRLSTGMFILIYSISTSNFEPLSYFPDTLRDSTVGRLILTKMNNPNNPVSVYRLKNTYLEDLNLQLLYYEYHRP